MSKVFTRKDIEILHFENIIDHDDDEPTNLYEYLEELKSKDIFVVDVTLINSISGKIRTDNHYMIRILRPVYDVEVKTYHLHDFSKKWDYVRTEIFGYFTSEKQADEIKKEYLKKSNSNVKFEAKIRKYSPLNQSV